MPSTRRSGILAMLLAPIRAGAAMVQWPKAKFRMTKKSATEYAKEK